MPWALVSHGCRVLIQGRKGGFGGTCGIGPGVSGMNALVGGVGGRTPFTGVQGVITAD